MYLLHILFVATAGVVVANAFSIDQGNVNILMMNEALLKIKLKTQTKDLFPNIELQRGGMMI